MSIAAARQYLAFPHLEPELRAELEPLVQAAEKGDAGALVEVNDRFFEPLAFGTGGLRGIMAAGLRRMNKPNVRRTTLALAQVAKARAPQARTALVGFDTRLQSDVFAREAARVLAAAGYQVYLGSRPLPTPFLCYAMRKLGTACGIIITASHNPKEYNGYKAYDDKGAQVVSPWDTDVEAAMASFPLVPEPPPAEGDARIVPIPAELEEGYLALGLELMTRPAGFKPAKVLYTPFHGTGIAFVPELFKRAGLPLEICASQAVQDGTFPTAPRPNPEEIAAYKAPLADAAKAGADVILANDPDADRIGLVAPRNGAWELMSGNDLAALTLDHLCTQKRLKGVLVTTVVTSDLLAEVGRRHGLEVMWTLTGFKNIALCMDILGKNGETYAYSAEESFGMQLSDQMRDKDGVLAALVVAEMVGHYKAQGMGPYEAVEALKARIGTFHNRLVNLEDPRPGGAVRFAEAMTRIRAAGLTAFAGEKVVSWEDFQSGEWHGAGKVEPILDRPTNPAKARRMDPSNVLKFRLESGAFAAFRPSGTEPKLKVYLQSRTDAALLDRMETEARALLGL
ncbi:phospho-sugar mutase [Mesoterricola silvestris]|uniref:Phosphomannomutase n=1 Tax=Mesoterricola silvestris TaxID=2927979 RepID=A0AA48H7C7_9BACT|nr:phospho-sugar mutase [Mesoterricola silvestris]BDU73128.1 phosphomannomutase [Mesoterricola silvestris]